MNDDLDQLLRNLRLKKIADIFDQRLAEAEQEGLPFEKLFAQLLRSQWEYQQQKALENRINTARLPEKWTLETFPFKRQPGVSHRQMRTFADLDFIPKAENIILIGQTGVGKTGLACGIFVKAQDLFDEMYASLADRSSRNLLNRLAKVDLLVIDEMGYLNIKPEQTNMFFKLIEERYRRGPTIITTNLDYEEWADFLNNKRLVEALLSRLRERCHTIRINGPCLRAQQG